jgi:hypothetical protein
MGAMNPGKIGLILTVGLGLVHVAVAAPACNVKAKIPAKARIFARTNEQSEWREYPAMADVPQLDLDSGMSAQFWQPKKGSASVYVTAPGEEFWVYTRYCFSGDGKLENVSFEIRTPLGWGHRSAGSITGTGFKPSSSQFFSTRNGKTIAKPAGVNDMPQDVKPTLYLKVSELPFAGLLSAATKPSGE